MIVAVAVVDAEEVVTTVTKAMPTITTIGVTQRPRT
jgi:hypothetical protein